MERILNALVLTPEQRAAFEAAAPGCEQLFMKDADITAGDLAGVTVVLGNPSVAAVQAGGGSIRWMHTRSAGADQYMPAGVLPEGAILSSSVGAYGTSVSEHMFAMLLSIMKRLPAYRDQQHQELWQRAGTARTLHGAHRRRRRHRLKLCGALQGHGRPHHRHPPQCEQTRRRHRRDGRDG